MEVLIFCEFYLKEENGGFNINIEVFQRWGCWRCSQPEMEIMLFFNQMESKSNQISP
jgi:hypothetical protein